MADGGKKVRVLIRPREGILDAQGTAVERALPSHGIDGVDEVRVGRLVELVAADPDRIDDLCQKLLANADLRGVD
ncbi:MAG: phosphoribosylformylglycinamidine synthase subunit PurS, partial [Solirubrobacterales bacterium]